MKLIFIVFMIGLVSCSGNSQALPRKGVKNETQNADTYSRSTKQFVSASGAFSVEFPERPKPSSFRIEQPWGKNEVNAYISQSAFEVRSVAYNDFPMIPTERSMIEKSISNQRDTLIQKLSMNLVSEKEARVGGVQGKEFVVSGNNRTIRIRVGIIKQRLFRLDFVHPGEVETIPEKLKSALDLKADSFFSSFAVRTLPEPEFPSTEFPEKFNTSIEDSTFFLKELGIKIPIPSNVQILSRDQSQALHERGLREAKLSRTYNGSTRVLQIENEPKNSSEKLTSIFAIVEKLEYPNLTPLHVGNEGFKTLVKAGAKPLSEVKTKIINGIEFAYFDYVPINLDLNTRAYLTNIDGIAFEIFFQYESDQKLAYYEGIFNGVSRMEKR